MKVKANIDLLGREVLYYFLLQILVKFKNVSCPSVLIMLPFNVLMLNELFLISILYPKMGYQDGIMKYIALRRDNRQTFIWFQLGTT